MTELKTSQALLQALKHATRPLSPEERHRQRVSFILGSLKPDSTISREQVESILARQEDARTTQ